ncbi:stalk domain-containing protein [Paenibacillus sp. LjRoot153]|uniref:stalk domain-containing protein n=1 Tax=Paenibacillus sp. LjRoot153 TaxID=3342270 RepID=UPI003ED02EB5
MKNISTKKTLVIISIASLALSVGAVAYADSTLRQISAYQNQELKVKVNGSEVDMSSEDGTMYPIVYDGHSYVSAKAVAEKLGASVKWNNDTQTVEISNGANSRSGVPDKDNTVKPPPTQAPLPTTAPSKGTSSDSGSLSDPVAFGSTFTYIDKYNYNEGKANSTSVKYAVTLKKVTPITREQIENLGFRKPEASTTVDYVMVELSVKATEATMKHGTNSGEREYTYLRTYVLKTWGSKTLDGSNSIIGGTDYGFDGALQLNVEEQVEFTEVTPGSSKSYEIQGKILLPILKGQRNLLVLRNQDSNLEYKDTMIHFKLQ